MTSQVTTWSTLIWYEFMAGWKLRVWLPFQWTSTSYRWENNELRAAWNAPLPFPLSSLYMWIELSLSGEPLSVFPVNVTDSRPQPRTQPQMFHFIQCYLNGQVMLSDGKQNVTSHWSTCDDHTASFSKWPKNSFPFFIGCAALFVLCLLSFRPLTELW